MSLSPPHKAGLSQQTCAFACNSHVAQLICYLLEGRGALPSGLTSLAVMFVPASKLLFVMPAQTTPNYFFLTTICAEEGASRAAPALATVELHWDSGPHPRVNPGSDHLKLPGH